MVETGKNSGTSHREERLEKRLNQAESKVTKLTAQLEANRRTSSKLTDEKLELQGRVSRILEMVIDIMIIDVFFVIWVLNSTKDSF